MFPDIIAELDADMSPATAGQWLELPLEYLSEAARGEGSVAPGLAPAAVAERFMGPMPAEGAPTADVIARVRRDIVADSNRLAHPMAMGHQVSPPLPAAIWAEPLAAALNQSLAVREMSPTATHVENQVVRWMCELAGFGPGAGGTLTSGGTEATFTALLAARAAALPDAWREGVGAEPPVVLCGEHAHYAVTRAVGELGLGMRRAIAIPSRDYRMDAAALERTVGELLDAGQRIMAVVATAGSTATGSFDDLERIGALCEARGLWLHVDGAHGASALLSARHMHRLRGISRARSVAWDPHKMMLMPLSAGMLIVRDERELDAAFAQRAPYLFHGAEGERVMDQGVRSFQCSRRFDALKLWVSVHRYGRNGLAAIHDHLCDLAAHMHSEISRRSAFEALHEPESNILCFRWVGDGSHSGAELDTMNRALRERWNDSGEGWITTTVIDGRRVLRVTFMNPRTTGAHVGRLLDGLDRIAGEASW